MFYSFLFELLKVFERSVSKAFKGQKAQKQDVL